MHPAQNAVTVQPLVFVPSTGPAPGATQHPAPAPACSTCRHKDLCLPGGLPPGGAQDLDRLMFSRRRVRRGESVFREGDAFRFLHAVRTGSFKCTATSTDGGQQVTAFRVAGEVMGFDALARGRHTTTATALEDAEVCVIPYTQLLALSARSPGLPQVLSSLMSREIVREHHLMMLLGSMNAEERLAAFLLNMSRRMQARGFSATDFHLRMSRAEIGSYLGLTLETVSRTFSGFQHHGLLHVDKKHVRDLDLDGLGSPVGAREH